MRQKNPWKTLSSKTVYQNAWMRVREDAVVRPDGSDGIYGVVESKDSVMVAALNDKNEVYLIRSFFYTASQWRWTMPGGSGDNEEVVFASKRELAEETGIVAGTWTFLQNVRVSGGLMTEQKAIYLAQDLTFGDRPAADDTDIIEQGKFIALDDIDLMIQNGEIDDAQTIAAVYLVRCWLTYN